jgi:hypothetical protein
MSPRTNQISVGMRIVIEAPVAGVLHGAWHRGWLCLQP